MKKLLPEILITCLLLFFGGLFSPSLSAQAPGEQLEVSGVVLSQSDGMPLPGATVMVKNTNIGAVTDFEGNYSISAPQDAILVYSYVGFLTIELPVDDQDVINVELEEDHQSLEEIVVTGYSSQRKKDITGSVEVVSMDAMKSLPAVSPDHALQGLASGVNVYSSGVPGAAASIRIRGVSSFGDTSPLVIVDGIEQELHHLNLNDIESMQVLKDAGAAAIYGVRGANGVIVITTKKGRMGAPTVTYEGSYGMKYPLSGNVWNVMNSNEFMGVYNKAFPGNALFANGMPDYTYRGPNGAGVAMAGDPAVDPSLYFYEKLNSGNNYIIQEVNKEGEDWFHNLFKDAPTQQHSLTASGGTEKSRYLFSLGYLDQQGTLVNSFSKRYTARINTSFDIGENLTVGENASIMYKEGPSFSNQAEFGGIGETFKLMPIIPLRDIMGNYAGTFGGPSLGTFQNPVAVQQRNVEKDLNYDWHIAGNIFAELTFLKDFTARSSLGFNVHNYYDQNYNATQTENIQASTRYNTLDIGSGYNSRMTFTNTLNYEKSLEKHHLNILAGMEAVEYTARSVTGGADNFFSDDFYYLDLDNGTANISNSSNAYSDALFSLFMRLDYNYDDKYIIGATIRRDGSSKFGPNQRYGVFPSVSAGWRVSSEEFMQDASWINDLKLRVSHGVLGSQNNVNADNAFSLYGSATNSTYYDLNGTSTSIVQGFSQSRIGNLNTGWEENVVSNIGVDGVFFNNKLQVSGEYYKKEIKGLLFSEPLPAVVLGGASAPTVNMGNIENSGVDISVNYWTAISRDFELNIGVNATTYKNIVKDIPDPGYFFSNSLQNIGSISRNEEGHPASSFYGYKILGLFNSEEEVASAPTQSAAAPGRFRYQDTNGDGLINGDDRVHLGDPNPDFTYGINLAARYKQFDLSALLFGSQGNDIFNGTRSYTHFMQNYPGNKSKDLLNAWTPDNMNTSIPIVEATNSFSTSETANSFYIEDGSYLRLKSLVIGYTFKPEFIQSFGIQNLRLYAQAANLFTLTDYSGLDPELGGSASSFGVDKGNYPNNEKNFLLGVNITF